MSAISFGRPALTICMGLVLLSLLSCSGGDSANQAADEQAPTPPAAKPSSEASSHPQAAPPTVSTTLAPKTEPDSFIKAAQAPPPSYPGLPGAVTKAPEWAVKNAPFDVVAYFTAPTDNAAPLYLDALFEFDPEDMKYCLAPRRSRATRTERTRRESSEQMRA